MYIGYFQYSLVLILIAMVVLDKFSTRRRSKIMAAVTLPIIGILPLAGIPAVGYLLGVFGQLSISSTIIIGATLIGHFSKKYRFTISDRTPIYVFIGIVGLIFYPMALGATLFDPYRLGYNPLFLISIMLTFTIASWLCGYRYLAICILFSAVAFNLQILESNNYWDYLFDVYLFIASMGFIVVYLVNRVRRYSSAKTIV